MRIAAINWFIFGCTQLAGYLFLRGSSDFNGLTLISPGILIVFGIACWFLAPVLSHLTAKGNDGQVSLLGVTLEQLYMTVFVSMGLYFALGNFGRVFSWIFYYVSFAMNHPDLHVQQASLYNLAEPLLKLIAGVFLILTANVWARRLVAKHSDGRAPTALS